MKASKNLLLAFLCLFLIACQTEKKNDSQSENSLGTLEHDFKISPEAKADFEKGLLLLHSFEYDDALTAFRTAKEKDSEEVMAYWGEAMSHYKALWGLQNKREGYAVLEEIGLTKEDRLASISDPLKKDFWEGAEILYGDGGLDERNLAFTKHMKRLHEKYPESQEASAFYALSLMWENGEEKDNEEIGMESAEISKGILAENPTHPGALHYTIHAYDDPDMADLAMDAANKYAKVAPDAAHALHMPSHIYLALGMWNDVASSNEVSYAASVKRMERLDLGDEARGYHSYAWLHYAYLQQGRVEEATELLKAMSDFYEGTQGKSIRSYIVSMQSAQLLETGEWSPELPLIYPKIDDLGLGSQMRMALFKGFLNYLDGYAGGVQEQIEHIEDEIKKAELYVSTDAKNMCNAGPSRYAPNEDDVEKARVVRLELMAIKNMMEDGKKVDEYLAEASEIEKASIYSFGPADIPLPSFDIYAKHLLENGKVEQALEQIETSLLRAPNRRMALLLKKEICEELGKSDEIRKVDELLSGFTPDHVLASVE